ncbi:MAG TPA: hypothetical protein VEC12_11915 [Bacteroidia bacterium]|nr:hypothetical protein [Bacteroidia bacterium]
MKLPARIIAAMLALLLYMGSYAQDTTFNIPKVYIEDDLKPVLSDAKKEATPPVAEKPQEPLPKLSYSIIPVQFRTVSRLDIPKAMEMGQNTVPALKNNYARLGFGNFNSPLVELYLHNKRSEYNSYGLSYRHLSATGPDDADFSDNFVSLFGKRFFKKGTLFADFDYARNAVRYYGRDRAFAEPGNDSMKQVFNTVMAAGGYQTNEWGKRKSQVGVWTKFHNLTDMWGVQENDLLVSGDFKTLIKDNTLKVNLDYSYVSYNDSLDKLGRHYVNLVPRYNLKDEKLMLSLGFNSTVYKDTGDVEFFLFPVVDAEYKIEEQYLSAIAGIGGGLQKNTYRGFMLENPFIGNRNAMNNTVNRFEGYVGLKGKANSNFGFLTRVFYNRYNDYAVFITDSTVLRRFKPLYIDMQALRFNLEVTYQYSEKIRFNFTGNFYGYKVFDSAQKPWQLPLSEIKANVIYNIGKKLIFTGDVFYIGKRPATVEYSGTSTTLKPFADFNLGLEYRMTNKRLSVFLRFNNISSSRYQRWYNYPSYGFNVLGGVTFSL